MTLCLPPLLRDTLGGERVPSLRAIQDTTLSFAFQGHPRHGRAGRRSAGVGRQRQQLQLALDRALRSAHQPVDHVNADAHPPQFGGRRALVLLQHGGQAIRTHGVGRVPVRRRSHRSRLGHRLGHAFAVQVHRHVCMIAVVDLQQLAVEQFRTVSLIAQLATGVLFFSF